MGDYNDRTPSVNTNDEGPKYPAAAEIIEKEKNKQSPPDFLRTLGFPVSDVDTSLLEARACTSAQDIAELARAFDEAKKSGAPIETFIRLCGKGVSTLLKYINFFPF